jgi:hypothetical protein
MYLTGLMLGCDVRDMDQGILEAMAIEDLAAGASHQGVRFLRRQFLASIPHRIFSSGPILLVTPSLKISLGSFRQNAEDDQHRVREGHPRARFRKALSRA